MLHLERIERWTLAAGYDAYVQAKDEFDRALLAPIPRYDRRRFVLRKALGLSTS